MAKTEKMIFLVLRSLGENYSLNEKAFKNGPSKICGRQSLKNLKGYRLLKQTITLQIF